MTQLELLAPARTYDIGIAAISCGADAVYIAGPSFGARKDAGNSVEDVRKLCDFAHRFGARIFVTLNTILFDEEIPEARKMLREIEDAGADGFIVQDFGVLTFGARVPLHASTQCAVRTPEKAAFLESLGFSRVVMERQTSLADIRAVREKIHGEIEYFVHGALCVSYSGQCYMSENIDGRSANRGACIQACRSLYDLVDSDGKVLKRNKALLSLKDYNLCDRLGELAAAGVNSFKIEGRLKNISYVRNVVRAYSEALDKVVAANPGQYCRASFGKVSGGFKPSLDKTFNRGYTSLFIDGERSRGWSSMDAPKSVGEYIGRIASVRPSGRFDMLIDVELEKGVLLKNGDGFCVVGKDSLTGFRGDVCIGSRITAKALKDVRPGQKLYRNISASFEKSLENNLPQRTIDVHVRMKATDAGVEVIALSEDGREATFVTCRDAEPARDCERIREAARAQIGKKTGDYSFCLDSFDGAVLPFLPASALNEIRRTLAGMLDAQPVRRRPLAMGTVDESVRIPEPELSYKWNVANKEARRILESRGAQAIDPAYELAHQAGAELMRMKYCIKYELGLCQKRQGAPATKPLFLLNNGRRFALHFDCRACEMSLTEA